MPPLLNTKAPGTLVGAGGGKEPIVITLTFSGPTIADVIAQVHAFQLDTLFKPGPAAPPAPAAAPAKPNGNGHPPSNVPAAAPNLDRARQAATGVVGPKCPVHGRNRLSKNPTVVHCPTRLEDGTYCTWTAPV